MQKIKATLPKRFYSSAGKNDLLSFTIFCLIALYWLLDKTKTQAKSILIDKKLMKPFYVKTKSDLFCLTTKFCTHIFDNNLKKYYMHSPKN